jgi:hypothetical protein
VPRQLTTFSACGALLYSIITFLGGFIGGPLLAYVTRGLLGEKIIEGAVAGFVAAISTEAGDATVDWMSEVDDCTNLAQRRDARDRQERNFKQHGK